MAGLAITVGTAHCAKKHANRTPAATGRRTLRANPPAADVRGGQGERKSRFFCWAPSLDCRRTRYVRGCCCAATASHAATPPLGQGIQIGGFLGTTIASNRVTQSDKK